MAQQPLTWRNINAPAFQNFDPTRGFAAGGAQLSEAGKQFLTLQEAADKQVTNQANARALLTGELDPNMNPRADAATVGTTLTDYLGAKADIGYTEAQTGQAEAETEKINEETLGLQFENSEAQQKLRTDATKAVIAQNLALAEERSVQAKKTRSELELSEKTRSGRDAIDREYQRIVEEKVTQLWRDMSPDPNNMQPLTPADAEELFQRAKTWAMTEEGVAQMKQFAKANDIIGDAWKESIYGLYETTSIEYQAEQKKIQDEELRFARSLGREAEYRASIGDFSMMDYIDGQVVPVNNKVALEAGRATTMADAWNVVDTIPKSIANTSKWRDDEDVAEAIQVLREKFPRKKLLQLVIQGYIQNGKLDVKKVMEDRQLRSSAMVQKALAAQGLAPEFQYPTSYSGRPGYGNPQGSPVPGVGMFGGGAPGTGIFSPTTGNGPTLSNTPNTSTHPDGSVAAELAKYY